MLAYLSRYTHRVAISNRRLISTDDKSVTFSWKDDRAEGVDRYKTMNLDIHEFIRRFLIHVFPKRFHHIRHHGLLANGNRAKNVVLARRLLTAQSQGPKLDAETSKTVDEQKTTEPSCPDCGGRMITIEVFEPGTTPTYQQRAPPKCRGSTS